MASSSKFIMSFSIGDVIAVSNLCVKIHDRCRAARGEFKELSVQALSLRGTLLSIGSLWGGQRLTDEERVELEAVAVPLSESLRKLENTTRKISQPRHKNTRNLGPDRMGMGWKRNPPPENTGSGISFEYFLYEARKKYLSFTLALV